jgi:hypothetical protein
MKLFSMRMGERASERQFNQNSLLPCDTIKRLFSVRHSELSSTRLSCCCGFICINTAQRQDLSLSAQAILDTVLGITAQKTIVHDDWNDVSSSVLFQKWLKKITEDDFICVMSFQQLPANQDLHDPAPFETVLHTYLKLTNLLELLLTMLSDQLLNADSILQHPTFACMQFPCQKSFQRG